MQNTRTETATLPVRDEAEFSPFQTVKRPLSAQVDETNFIKTMEELFGPHHPIAFLGCERTSDFYIVQYAVLLDPGEDPYMRQMHTDINWQILTHFWVLDKKVRPCFPDVR